jgi:hypothetical protein
MAGIARQSHQQLVHYIRRGFTFADNGVALTIGTLPAGALINKAMSGIHIVTAFNAGTANVADVGTAADDDYFGTDLALGTTTFVPLDEVVGGYRLAADTDITITLGLTGTAATTGDGEVVICYIPDNDR